MQFLAMDEKTYVSTNVTLLAPWLRGALNRSKAISVRIHAKRRNRNSFTKKACLEKGIIFQLISNLLLSVTRGFVDSCKLFL
jgi:hypothetical protein